MYQERRQKCRRNVSKSRLQKGRFLQPIARTWHSRVGGSDQDGRYTFERCCEVRIPILSQRLGLQWKIWQEIGHSFTTQVAKGLSSPVVEGPEALPASEALNAAPQCSRPGL